MPSITVLVIMLASALFLIYSGIQAFTIKGAEPIVTLPETTTGTQNYDVFKTLSNFPFAAVYDLIFGGVWDFVKWFAELITGLLSLILNFIIGSLNSLLKLSLPPIVIPQQFTFFLLLALLGLFIISQVRNIADRTYGGIILFTSLILTAIATILIIVIFTSFFI